ncbi:hypothetical protein HK096_005466 [Nowakowskiella sp. JEL0078]|nr:hypothetical protein HK096_005466 [Nowakowskiella sp. JEL0078]
MKVWAIVWTIYLVVTFGIFVLRSRKDKVLKKHGVNQVGIAVFSLFCFSVPGLLVRGWTAENGNIKFPCIVIVAGFIFGVPSFTFFLVIRSFRLYYFLVSNRQIFLDSERRESHSQYSYRSSVHLETEPERKWTRFGLLKNATESDSNTLLLIWFVILIICSVYTYIVGYVNSKVNFDSTQVDCTFG